MYVHGALCMVVWFWRGWWYLQQYTTVCTRSVFKYMFLCLRVHATYGGASHPLSLCTVFIIHTRVCNLCMYVLLVYIVMIRTNAGKHEQQKCICMYVCRLSLACWPTPLMVAPLRPFCLAAVPFPDWLIGWNRRPPATVESLLVLRFVLSLLRVLRDGGFQAGRRLLQLWVGRTAPPKRIFRFLFFMSYIYGVYHSSASV